MDNFFWFLLCLFLFVTTITAFFYSIFRHGKRSIGRWYSLFFAVLLGWTACEGAFFLIKSAEPMLLVNDFRLVFQGALAWVFFYIVAKYYKQAPLSPKWLTTALAVFPLITAALALTTNSHDLLFSNHALNSVHPVLQLELTRGVWFYVHIFYCIFLCSGATVICAAGYIRLPAEHRSGLVPITAAGGLMTAGFIYLLFPRNLAYIDFSLLCATVGGILIFSSISVRAEGAPVVERKYVFDHFKDSIFILNEHGRVISLNKAAEELLNSFGERLMGRTFDEFIADKVKSGDLVPKQPEAEEDKDAEYYNFVRYNIFFKVRKRQIEDSDTYYFARVSNITRQRLTVERLMATAGYDALTGLLNRYGHINLLRTLDVEENLPLGIIMGDVNGLKKVNDDFGHKVGDDLLILVGKALREGSPHDIHVARIGGDEFITIFTNATPKMCREYISRVKDVLDGDTSLPTPPSISFGFVLKQDISENLNLLLNQADLLMYETKASEKCF